MYLRMRLAPSRGAVPPYPHVFGDPGLLASLLPVVAPVLGCCPLSGRCTDLAML